MKVQAKAGHTFLALDNSRAGEGLAIFLGQDNGSLTRWIFEVFAKLDSSENIFVGEFTTTNPGGTNPPGRPSRQVALAVCPGAVGWSVIVSPVVGSQNADDEVCDVTLASSRCCTAPAGVTRVGERYSYSSGDTALGDTSFTIAPGRVVTRINVLGKAPGGTVIIGTGSTISVPANFNLVLEPKATIPPQTVISFTNSLWVVEYLDSA